MASQILSQRDKKAISDAFKSLDTNGDGKLSKEELISGFNKVLNDKELSKKKVDSIWSQLNDQARTSIDYSGIVDSSK